MNPSTICYVTRRRHDYPYTLNNNVTLAATGLWGAPGYEKMTFFSSPMRAAEPMIPEPGSWARGSGCSYPAPGLYGWSAGSLFSQNDEPTVLFKPKS